MRDQTRVASLLSVYPAYYYYISCYCIFYTRKVPNQDAALRLRAYLTTPIGEGIPAMTIQNANTMNIGNIDLVKFNADGFVPAIAQQSDTGEVLMMAWMTRDTLQETITTGRACYWSRSRKEFWRKGDTSGHIQTVKEVRLDCDGDTILLLIEQTGAACHKGKRSCFQTRLK